MVISEDGHKWSCEKCIRGHRASSCQHTDQPLVLVRPKGRPASQCQHCRDYRKTNKLHTKCLCGSKSAHAHSIRCPCAFDPELCTCASKKSSVRRTASNPPPGNRRVTGSSQAPVAAIPAPVSQNSSPVPRSVSTTSLVSSRSHKGRGGGGSAGGVTKSGYSFVNRSPTASHSPSAPQTPRNMAAFESSVLMQEMPVAPSHGQRDVLDLGDLTTPPLSLPPTGLPVRTSSAASHRAPSSTASSLSSHANGLMFAPLDVPAPQFYFDDHDRSQNAPTQQLPPPPPPPPPHNFNFTNTSTIGGTTFQPIYESSSNPAQPPAFDAFMSQQAPRPNYASVEGLLDMQPPPTLYHDSLNDMIHNSSPSNTSATPSVANSDDTLYSVSHQQLPKHMEPAFSELEPRDQSPMLACSGFYDWRQQQETNL